MEKRGRGRPPKGDAALDVEVKVRFSPDMITKVDRLAERRGTTRTVLIRSCVAGAIQIMELNDRADNPS